VVDQYGGVLGVEGLHIADASVVPKIPPANTNLTCIVIGERMVGVDAASVNVEV
jgi:choline dehydrogenase-like flavoprotein